MPPNDTAPAMPPQDQLPAVIAFTPRDAFELVARQAKVYAQSSLVPTDYQNNPANCLIALNMAARIGADPLMTMQNLYVVHGRPGWSGQFLIASFNQCGRFSAMRFEWKGDEAHRKEWACRAYATEKATGEKVIGPWVSWTMAEAENWTTKKGSKWQTMPELMFHYRAAAFMVRTHAPEIAMGLQTTDEIHDVFDVTPTSSSTSNGAEVSAIDRAKDKVREALKPAETIDAGTGEVTTSDGEKQEVEPLAYAYVMNEINIAPDVAAIDAAKALIERVADERQRAELDVEERAKRHALTK